MTKRFEHASLNWGPYNEYLNYYSSGKQTKYEKKEFWNMFRKLEDEGFELVAAMASGINNQDHQYLFKRPV